VVVPSYLVKEHGAGCPSCCLLYEGIAELVGQDFHERYEEIFSYSNHVPVFGSNDFFEGEVHIRLWPGQGIGPSVGLELFVEDGKVSRSTLKGQKADV
jgi:hypothetical protein